MKIWYIRCFPDFERNSEPHRVISHYDLKRWGATHFQNQTEVTNDSIPKNGANCILPFRGRYGMSTINYNKFCFFYQEPLSWTEGE